MMSRPHSRIALTAIFFTFTLSIVSSAGPTGVPPFFSQFDMSSMQQLGLGSACYASLAERYDRPCQPAFAAFAKESHLDGHVILGGDYGQVFRYKDFIDRDDKASLAQTLAGQIVPMQAQGFLSFLYTAEHFNILATPFHAGMFAVTQNTVSPEVLAVAVQEMTLSSQFGFKFSDEFYGGLEVSGIQRRYV